MSRFAHRLARAILCGAATLSILVPSNGQATKSTPVIRTTTRIVYVDVVVRDGNGKIVRGLRQDDFAIREDRRPQRTSVFEEHAFEAARGPAAPVSGQLSNVPAESANTSLNIVLLDLLNTSLLDQAYARKRMIAFLQHLPPGRQVAVMVLSNELRMVQNFTTDSAVLAKAAETIDLQKSVRYRDRAQQNSDTELAAYMDSQATIPRTGDLLQKYVLQEDVSNTIARLEATNQAFRQIALAVNGYPGRKNLFWLATEFPSSSYYDLQGISSIPRGTTISTPQGNRLNPERDETREAGLPSTAGLGLSSFGAVANKVLADSQIAVYPISLVGIETDSAGPESGAGGAGSATTSGDFFARQQGREVMNHIADETGGEAFYGNNDPALMLQRGLESGENFYTLAYQPTDHNWNGQYRKIQVSLKSSGYHLTYRRGYFATPEQPAGNATAQFASAVRAETPPSTALVVRALTPGPPVNGDLRLQAVLGLSGVTFWVDKNGDHRARMQVRLIAYPHTATATPIESNAELNLGLTDGDYQMLLQKGVPVQQTLHLPPGEYTVRLGALDLNSGRIGTLTFPYAVP